MMQASQVALHVGLIDENHSQEEQSLTPFLMFTDHVWSLSSALGWESE